MHLYTLLIDDRPILVTSVDSDDAREAWIEIQESLDSWLGEDLNVFETGGRPIWDGEVDAVQIRKADGDEIIWWKSSYEEAKATGEAEAFDRSWLVYLVPVSDPGDHGNEEF